MDKLDQDPTDPTPPYVKQLQLFPGGVDERTGKPRASVPLMLPTLPTSGATSATDQPALAVGRPLVVETSETQEGRKKAEEMVRAAGGSDGQAGKLRQMHSFEAAHSSTVRWQLELLLHSLLCARRGE